MNQKIFTIFSIVSISICLLSVFWIKTCGSSPYLTPEEVEKGLLFGTHSQEISFPILSLDPDEEELFSRKNIQETTCLLSGASSLFYLDSQRNPQSRAVTSITPLPHARTTEIRADQYIIHVPWSYQDFDSTHRTISWKGLGSDGTKKTFNIDFPEHVYIYTALACCYADFVDTAPIIFPFESSFPKDDQPKTRSWSYITPLFHHCIRYLEILSVPEKNKSVFYARIPSQVSPYLEDFWAPTCDAYKTENSSFMHLPCHPEDTFIPLSFFKYSLGGTAGLMLGGALGGLTAGVVGGVTGVILSTHLCSPLLSLGITPQKKAYDEYLQQAQNAWAEAALPQGTEIPLQEIPFVLESGPLQAIKLY